MAIAVEKLQELVSLERGELDRSIFRDSEIFEQEMQMIFARSWLFLCHESQIRKKGDFFEAPMGRDNVLVVRQKDGSIKALLNTCLHRGNAVCRAEEGNARNFMCTYHGWTYDISGDLVGVPGLAELYHNDLDTAANGLREVAQLDTFMGFVFATADPEAPPLHEFLGRTGRLALAMIAAQGDMEIIPGVQKFVIPCNWKFPGDNVFDFYHPQVTHVSAFRSGILPPLPDPTARGRKVGMSGVAAPDGSDLELFDESMGDHIVFIDQFGHGVSGQTADSLGDMGGLLDNSWRADSAPEAEQFGRVGRQSYGHGNIFPTCSVLPWILQIGLRVPRGPQETEIWWFAFVKKDASPERKALMARRAIITFGPGGLAEQDDGENWTQSTKQTHGETSSKIPQLLLMDLGHGKVVQDDDSLDPPYIHTSINEHGQRWTYHAWKHWMSGVGWNELRELTTPPDVL
ncbi:MULTISPECIES: aromatic ring-hydroxylating oxygenase subunit alpha [unclassified Mycobacterium]|uniref:aromatic ring-hydroxylating oxygenase subunit alpha n=1 Tax=unclassified Mycobacterium TaxID=2642494 RepID=UPI0029C8539B|nr:MULTISPECIES: Rieske 2Fe-2S domain-containing protein [unclassified Mycobacterium]